MVLKKIWSESLVFWVRKSENAIRSHTVSLFIKEWFAQGRSFLKSDKSESFLVKEWRAKERIPNPGFGRPLKLSTSLSGYCLRVLQKLEVCQLPVDNPLETAGNLYYNRFEFITALPSIISLYISSALVLTRCTAPPPPTPCMCHR